MKKSKSQQVIDYLEKGNSLTKKECYQMFSLWNLGHEIYKLRKRFGQDYIITLMLTTVLGAEYASYKINPEYLYHV